MRSGCATEKTAKAFDLRSASLVQRVHHQEATSEVVVEKRIKAGEFLDLSIKGARVMNLKEYRSHARAPQVADLAFSAEYKLHF